MADTDHDPLTAVLAGELNVAPTDALNDDVVTARGLVAQAVSGYETRFAEEPAQTVYNRAIRKCAGELYDQRKAPSGVRNFADMDSVTVVRVARDPMVAARPLLAPYLPLAVS
jgi:hypothetical protein